MSSDFLRAAWVVAAVASVWPASAVADAVAYTERGSLELESPLSRDPEKDRAAEEPEQKRETQLFWLHTAPGFQWVRLTAFEAEEAPIPSADLVSMNADGPVLSTGLGLRFRPITLGARGSVGFLSDASANPASDLTLWSINAEIGFWFIPEGRIEPYLLLSGGYSRLTGSRRDGSFEVSGPNARAAFGIDYFASELVSVGLMFSGELLFLTKPGVSASDLLASKKVKTIEEARAQVEQVDGTRVGTALSLMIGPSLHFD